MAAAVELFPVFARAHLLRSWAGIVDVTPDAQPDRRADPLRRTCSSTAAGAPAGSRRRPASAGASPTRSPTASRTRWSRRSALDRFITGALVDEHGAAAVAH